MFYASDVECDGLLDEITKIHCFGFNDINSDNFFVFCRLKELEIEYKNKFEAKGIQFFELDKVVDLIKSPKTRGFSYHAGLSYDLEVIKRFYNIDYDWCGHIGFNHIFEDTYVNSMYLYPDRQLPKGCPSSIKFIDKDGNEKSKKIGPHSLESWAYRTGTSKSFVDDWRTQPLHVYVDRVVNDCIIQKATHFLQQKEIKDVAINNGDKKGDWETPLKMAHKTYWLMQQQERTGVCFDIKKAEELIVRIDKEMKEIEEEVEPKLGMRILPAGEQPNFPLNPFKKPFNENKLFKASGGLTKSVTDYLNKIEIPDYMQEDYICSMLEKEDIEGNCIIHNYIIDEIDKHSDLLTQSAINYCETFGVIDKREQVEYVEMLCRFRDDGKFCEVEPKLDEKLKLSHKKDVKYYLISELGWKPTMWKPRNILINPKTKQKLSDDEINKKLDAYIKEFEGSVIWPFILEFLEYKKNSNVDTNTESFRKKCLSNGRNLPSSPQYTDQRGELCKNLAKLDSEMAKKICRWLSLQNRRNTILSENGTGLLTHKRLKVDGRLPAGSSGITPTFRKKHTVCVNIPKPKDSVVLGKEMRSLFYAKEPYVNVGGDGASLEAMVASHYTIPFDGGIYASGVLSGTFHDDNAKAYSEVTGNYIDRDSGKNFTYMILYGGSGKKAAKMASVSERKGQEIIDAFWETNLGLKKLKDAIEQYWEATGRKYIYGLGGQKVFVRSKHSLLNTLFQHSGSLILDFAQCYVYDKVKEFNFDIYRWGEFHDEAEAYEHKCEIETYYFDIDNKPSQDRDGRLYSKPKIIRDGIIIHDKVKEEDYLKTDKWIQFYAPFGHYLDQGFMAASKFFKTNVTFRVEYMVGRDWSQCH